MNGKFNELNFLIERRHAQEKYFKNYKFYTWKIKKIVQRFLGEVKVFVFGSILRKDEVPRDIDILIISPKLKTPNQKSKIRVKIFEKIGFGSPFEIHLITPEEYQSWYQNFIKEKVEI